MILMRPVFQEATRWKCLAGIGGGSLGDEP